jgi:hypothetical protein
VTVAIFSAAPGFQPPAGRQRFFPQLCALATELWAFQVDEQNQMSLLRQDGKLGVLTPGTPNRPALGNSRAG